MHVRHYINYMYMYGCTIGKRRRVNRRSGARCVCVWDVGESSRLALVLLRLPYDFDSPTLPLSPPLSLFSLAFFVFMKTGLAQPIQRTNRERTGKHKAERLQRATHMSERKSPSSGRGAKQTPKRRGGGVGGGKHGSSAASSGLLLKLSDLNAAGAVQSGVGETHVMPTGSPSRPADMYRWDIHSELSTTEMKRASSTSQLGGGGAAGGGSASGNGNGGGGGAYRTASQRRNPRGPTRPRPQGGKRRRWQGRPAWAGWRVR